MSAISRWATLRRPALPLRLLTLGAGVAVLGAAGIALASGLGDGEAEVLARLKTRLPKTEVGKIDCAKLSGLCEVTAGTNLFYVDRGVRYLVIGRVYDMETRQDLTAARLLEINPDMLLGGSASAGLADAGAANAPARAAAPETPRTLSLAGLPKDGAIVWGNPAARDTITIFTDFSCSYCRALHTTLASMDVKVIERPISILGSRELSERVYCARDRAAAVRAAYAGRDLQGSGSCDTSGLDGNERFAARNGLNGTPIIVRNDGAMIEGYRPKEFLQRWLAEGRS